MDALILTCGTGGGHNSACEALAEEFSARGHHVRTMNPYLLKGGRVADTVDNAYISLVQKAPAAFGMVYHLGDAYRRLPLSSPVHYANKAMVGRLSDYLRENPCDVIVTTHLFPGEILSNMKKAGKKLPVTYYIATDYTCIPFTEETDCDYYVIPTELVADDFERAGIPKEKILPFGIPLRKQFLEKRSREEARESLGLSSDRLNILIGGGSIGAGQIEKVVPLLLEHFGQRARLTVICGSNRELYERMRSQYEDRCDLLEYTPKMADYMRSCDLFLTKPGGLSSTEAAVIGTALIHITPIPGCEPCNMEFFERNGLSIAVTSPEKQLAEACDALLDDTRRREMLDRQREFILADGSSSLCDHIERRVLPASSSGQTDSAGLRGA